MMRTLPFVLILVTVLCHLDGATGQYGFNPYWSFFVEEPPMMDDPMPGHVFGSYNPGARYHSNRNMNSRHGFRNNGMYNMFWGRGNVDY